MNLKGVVEQKTYKSLPKSIDDIDDDSDNLAFIAGGVDCFSYEII